MLLAHLEAVKNEEEHEKLERGDSINNNTIIKMRIVEAVHHESFRKELLEIDTSLSRIKLDRRNAEDRPPNIWELSAHQCNNRDWKPMSSRTGIHRLLDVQSSYL